MRQCFDKNAEGVHWRTPRLFPVFGFLFLLSIPGNSDLCLDFNKDSIIIRLYKLQLYKRTVKSMTKNTRVLVLVGAFALCFCCPLAGQAADDPSDQLVREAKAVIKEVSVHDVKKMIDAKEKVTILDIRGKKEYDEEHIRGAINLPLKMNTAPEILENHIHALIADKSARIIVYCEYDKRSPMIVKSLNGSGYKNAVNMKGGFEAWDDANYPVEEQK